MKSTQRLEYNRFADALAERGLVDRQTLQSVVQQCAATGALMTDILVREELVSDWEVARVACELYGLPYVPVESYPPADGVLDGLDPAYLRQYGVVPLDRFGKVLTVTMPGIVPSEILDGLSPGSEIRILPAVGSVVGNRKWLAQHLPAPSMPSIEDVDASLPGGSITMDDISEADIADWGDIFDAGDQAVQQELRLKDE